jgi:iturin family lipopeptide synthetase A
MIETNEGTGLEVAIIGMAGRFPGSGNIKEYWENLKKGKESITFFTHEELKKRGCDPRLVEDPNYVKAYGVLEKPENFDAAFFNYTPGEATVMDPQIRALHEVAWEALEEAGIEPEKSELTVGLYVGASSNFNWEALSMMTQLQTDSAGFFSGIILNNKDFVSTRLSYNLNLEGPSLTVHTACSTSLVAVDLAYRGILTGQCDIALAGGASIQCPHPSGYLYQEGMIYSPDGHTRTFDAEARGSVFGEGVGMVVLKSLEEALEDRDHIYAIIKGSATNNDGNRKVGYTAPGVKGQASVVKSALHMSRVEPETITYIEAHGTATSLGDPIEIKALNQAFKTGKKQYCAIGTVKTNIGHLDVAAGVAGLIKTALAIKHKMIPPSLHYKEPNPRIDFENSPFYVNATLAKWEGNGHPLRAGVSSFGIGGTNAHVILEEAPPRPPASSEDQGRGESCIRPINSCSPQLILLSAKTTRALDKMTGNLGQYLEENSGASFADVAYTLSTGRKTFAHRWMMLCSNSQEAKGIINQKDTRSMKTHIAPEEKGKRPIVFLFSGLGSQYENMGKELYQKEPYFQEILDSCFEILTSLTNKDFKQILFPNKHTTIPMDQKTLTIVDAPKGEPVNTSSPMETESKMMEPQNHQPLLFAFEYALARLLMSWGIQPHTMMGYSFGEYVCATIAGVVTLQEALQLVVVRSQLLEEIQGGGMLSVPLRVEEIQPLLPGDIYVAIDNGHTCIVAGPDASLENFENQLRKQKYMCLRVSQTHALHTQYMEPLKEKFQKREKELTPQEPVIPYVSNVTGTWITPEQVKEPGYWTQHLTQPVRFSQGIRELLKKDPESLFIEIGPGQDLSNMVHRFAEEITGKSQPVFNLVRASNKKESDLQYLLKRIGQLWLLGVNIDWIAYYRNQERNRLSMPTYPFEGKAFWIKGDPLKLSMENRNATQKLKMQASITDWFYQPHWKRTSLNTKLTAKETGKTEETWILFTDKSSLAKQLGNGLKAQGKDFMEVRIGKAFKKTETGPIEIDPSQPIAYEKLISQVQEKKNQELHILHLWNITPVQEQVKEKTEEWCKIRPTLDKGFYSLIYLAKAIGNSKYSHPVKVHLVSNNLFEVTGDEELQPHKATLLGPSKVISQEYPNIDCQVIDIEIPEAESCKEEELAEQLQIECEQPANSGFIAYRKGYRWEQIFEPLPLSEQGINKKTRIKENGVYLITGGLGHIGYAFATHLTRTAGAKLILTGRTPLPSEEEWNTWIETQGKQDPISQRILKLKTLQDMGGEVIFIGVDISKKDQIAEEIHKAEKKLGPIQGIIHAAGDTGKTMVYPIQYVTEPECQPQFKAKILGLQVLGEVFKGRNLDFCLLISSLSPILGGLGFAAYSAANIYMDAYVYQYNRNNSMKWISVNWGDWKFPGRNTQESSIGKTIAEFEMTPEQGIETFHRILQHYPVNQVIISSGDLQARIDQWIHMKSLQDEEDSQAGAYQDSGPSQHSRPELMNPYVQPSTPMEEEIAAIWQKIFGFQQIGTTDDFFELGGDSLKAITAISRMHKKLQVSITLPEFFKKPVIGELAAFLEGSSKGKSFTILPVEEREYYPLSPSQKRLFVLHQMNQKSLVYNEFQVFLQEGQLNPGELEKAVNRIIQQQDSLRTKFRMHQGEPIQSIQKQVEFKLDYFNLEENKSGQDQKEREIAIIKEYLKPFDLSQAPLLRIGLIKAAPERNILITDKHHIITDGTSNNLFIKELMEQYAKKPLKPIRIQYKDFSEWQRKMKTAETGQKQEEYWMKKFNDDVPVLNLSTDYPRPAKLENKGQQVNFEISEEETGKLKLKANQLDSTLFMMVMTIFTIQLSKFSGQEDIVIGIPTIGRKHPDLEEIIGMFVNTLALRHYPGGEKQVQQFIREVKDEILESYQYEDYPFENLVDKVVSDRDLSRNPLFDVMCISQNLEKRTHEYQGNAPTPYGYEEQTTKFDLILGMAENQDHLRFYLKYRTKLFTKETINRFIYYFRNILTLVLENQEIALSEIEIISEPEKEQIIREFNDTQRDYPHQSTLHELFEEQAKRTPSNLGTIYKDHQITYGEINKKTHQQAVILRERGVDTRQVVALMMERSIEMLLGMIAILKAGSAYLPILPGYPWERKNFYLKDSTVQILVTQKSQKREAKEKLGSQVSEIIILESEECSETSEKAPSPDTSIQPSDPVYVFYTSGTTGKPKGVVVEHTSVVNIVTWFGATYQLKPGIQMLNMSEYTFDASINQIFGALLYGATVNIPTRDLLANIQGLRQYIRQRQIHYIYFVPTYLKELLCFEGKLGSLQNVISGADKLNDETKDAILKRGYQLYNHYGPTEATVDALSTPCVTGKGDMGTPLPNMRCYIFDKWDHLTPIGVIGELYISGVGVARGYLNNPDLTEEKFIETRLLEGERLYRSGDLARWLPEGEIQLLGRIDEQVKIRGFRIEPEEIESHLKKHQDINEAVVITREDKHSDKHLYAYIQSEKEFQLSELKQYLSGKLPDYMVPSYFVRVDKIPVNSNGKVDRKALMTLGKLMETGTDYVEPAIGIEKKVAEVWAEILDQENISVNDNFFDLGGNSLKAIQLSSKLMEKLNIEVSVVALFEYLTIRTFSAYITTREIKKEEENTIDRSNTINSAKTRREKQMSRRRQR